MKRLLLHAFVGMLYMDRSLSPSTVEDMHKTSIAWMAELSKFMDENSFEEIGNYDTNTFFDEIPGFDLIPADTITHMNTTYNKWRKEYFIERIIY